MQHRRLGLSELEVPVVVFGAWAIGGWNWGGSDDELAIATEILTSAANGSAPGEPAASSVAAAAIEDLLWSVVMLPEFHLIR